MKDAPLFSEIAEAPTNGKAYWLQADDGIRLRVGLWPSEKPQNGTIFIFPGRTEYIEKYGRTVSDLAELGFTSFVIDWRGQGLAERVCDDPMTGHVDRFADYHKDVAAMVRAAKHLGLPQPWFLIGHSLGACIGLRAILEGLHVSACVFTSPMWGINLPVLKRAAAWPVSWAVQALGKRRVYAPGTNGESYVMATPFRDNRLTNDPEMYEYYIRQIKALPKHQLGGPSMGWLYQTLKETRTLSKRPSPDIPCLSFCGAQDVVVDIPAMHLRMDGWAKGTLEVIPNAKHDIFSEVPAIRKGVAGKIAEFVADEGNKEHSGDTLAHSASVS